jgi:cbb3-type cytochrome oxidase maturation protein
MTHKSTARMDILILLIPLSVGLVLAIAAGFWWSVKSGQFDDLEGPAHRILDDDDRGVATPHESGAHSTTPQDKLTSVKIPGDTSH